MDVQRFVAWILLIGILSMVAQRVLDELDDNSPEWLGWALVAVMALGVGVFAWRVASIPHPRFPRPIRPTFTERVAPQELRPGPYITTAALVVVALAVCAALALSPGC